ncbi:MAG: class I SAM-dependent methyltransferase [Ginsengibacter sp.]
MKLIYYARYFFFIGLNWNLRLAFFTIFHEIRGEKKYNLDSIGMDRLHSVSIKGGNLQHASIYQASHYYILEKGFSYLQSINENNNLTDFGCGKGRALVVAAYFGFEDITGIDFAKELCIQAEHNIQKTRLLYPSVNFNVICEDVVSYKIKKEQHVFFFFNPFDEVIMLQVVKNILSSLKENSRKIYIMYINPVHKEIFLSAGFEEEYYKRKLNYIEVSIMSNRLDDDDELDRARHE